jgi:phosphoglycolate phosphatase
MKKLVIFDLDGTLLNSIADLAVAVNQALEKCGFPTHEEDAYRFMVGDGVMKLFERALPEGEKSEENVLRIREHFMPFYEVHNADLSRPYDGVLKLLAELKKRGLRMAVASNKYHTATLKLVAHYFHDTPFEIVLGNREGVPVKPNPQIVEEILEHTGVAKSEALYVGDTNVDMKTAINAEVECVGVAWGFRPKVELAAHNPLAIIDNPLELLEYI